MVHPHDLLPDDVRPSLPWSRDKLRSIELPASSRVPAGAQRTKAGASSLLLRSTCETPLDDGEDVLLDAQKLVQELAELRVRQGQREVHWRAAPGWASSSACCAGLAAISPLRRILLDPASPEFLRPK